MTWSFEALAGRGRAVVPAALAPPSTWPPAGTFARAWPLRVAAIGGVECRLGPRAGPADLAFCISVASGGRATLAETLRAPSPTPDQAPEHAGGVERFLARWGDSRSPLHAGVPAIWLEFDHGPLAAGRPEPFVVFKVDEGVRSPDAVGTLLREGVAALAGRAVEAHVGGALRCLAALPGSGRLLHVGVMPHRGTDAIRLIVTLPRSGVAGLLRALAWRGDAGAIDTVLAELCPRDDTLSVHVDVGGEIGRRVGVEFYRPTSPREDAWWAPLLDGLVRMGACTPAERDALLAWPTPEANASDAPSGLFRQLLVKAVFERDTLFEAKAYLAFIPRVTLFGARPPEIPEAGTPACISPPTAPGP